MIFNETLLMLSEQTNRNLLVVSTKPQKYLVTQDTVKHNSETFPLTMRGVIYHSYRKFGNASTVLTLPPVQFGLKKTQPFDVHNAATEHNNTIMKLFMNRKRLLLLGMNTWTIICNPKVRFQVSLIVILCAIFGKGKATAKFLVGCSVKDEMFLNGYLNSGRHLMGFGSL